MKRQIVNNMFECLLLFNLGGFIYYMIEVFARGYSHWSMYLLGGFCFIIIGLINERFDWDVLFQHQCLIGAGVITVLEFITGVIVNILLGWNIWDYSDRPCNLLGQICLKNSIYWIFLSGIAILLDDYVRYTVFDEEFPRYSFRHKKK